MTAVTEAERMAAPTPQLHPVPWSNDAEQAVLGALMLDTSAWDSVADILGSGDFFAQAHRAIFDAIGGLAMACKPADMLSVHDRLQASHQVTDYGGLAYLNALQQGVPSAANARRHAEIVREKSLQRAVIAATDTAAVVARDPALTMPERMDRIGAAIEALHREQTTQEPQSLQSLLVRRIDHLNDLASGDVPPGWPTGLEDVDEALNGGLQPGRVYVVAARPSGGKTAWALQVAQHRARAGDGVLVLSQEMPAGECTDRMIANAGGIDYGRLQRGHLSDSEWSKLTAAADELGKLPLWIDDQPGLRLADIRAKAMSLRRQGLRLLVIDYLQLCTGTNPGKGVNRNSELEEISRGIKTLAKQLGIAVLLISQLSREVEKRQIPKPTLSDLRDSGAIEQDADAVLFLWPVRTFKGSRIVALSIAKNRQGRNEVDIALEFQGWCQAWQSSDADISPESMKPARKPTDGGFE